MIICSCCTCRCSCRCLITLRVALARKVFQLGGLALGHGDDLGREAHNLGDVDAKRLVAHAGPDSVEERDLLLGLCGAVAIFMIVITISTLHGIAAAVLPLNVRHNVQVAHLRMCIRQRGQLVEVRCEQRRRADVEHDVFSNSPGEAEAVVRRRAPAELVDDDERLCRGGLEDVGRLEHLRHKGRDALQLRVACANARDNAIVDAQLGRGARHEAADLAHERDHAGLADVGRLPAHVRPRDDGELGLALPQRDVVSDEGDVVLHFHARMPRFGQDGVAGAARMDGRPDVLSGRVYGNVGEGDDHVEMCEHAGEPFDDGAVGC